MTRHFLNISVMSALALLSLSACNGKGSGETTDFGPEPWDDPNYAEGATPGRIERSRPIRSQSQATLRIERGITLRNSETLESKSAHFQGGAERSLEEIDTSAPRCMLLVSLSTEEQARIVQSSYRDGIKHDSETSRFSLEPATFPLVMSGVQSRQLRNGTSLMELPIDDSRGIIRSIRCHFTKPPEQATIEDFEAVVGDALEIEAKI